jgi:hypothetical protein
MEKIKGKAEANLFSRDASAVKVLLVNREISSQMLTPFYVSKMLSSMSGCKILCKICVVVKGCIGTYA